MYNLLLFSDLLHSQKKKGKLHMLLTRLKISPEAQKNVLILWMSTYLHPNVLAVSSIAAALLSGSHLILSEQKEI